MIRRRDFSSYDEYVHAQGGKARSHAARLLERLPAQRLAFSVMFREAVPHLLAGPVLCLGARSGAEVETFESLGFKGSVGIDLHPVGKGVRRGDWHHMPEFADGAFATVYSNSFDHCLYPEQACAEVRRVLQPGGRFYLQASDKGEKDETRAARWAATQEKHNEAIYWDRAEDLRDLVRGFGFRLCRQWKNRIWSSFLLEPK